MEDQQQPDQRRQAEDRLLRRLRQPSEQLRPVHAQPGRHDRRHLGAERAGLAPGLRLDGLERHRATQLRPRPGREGAEHQTDGRRGGQPQLQLHRPDPERRHRPRQHRLHRRPPVRHRKRGPARAVPPGHPAQQAGVDDRMEPARGRRQRLHHLGQPQQPGSLGRDARRHHPHGAQVDGSQLERLHLVVRKEVLLLHRRRRGGLRHHRRGPVEARIRVLAVRQVRPPRLPAGRADEECQSLAAGGDRLPGRREDHAGRPQPVHKRGRQRRDPGPAERHQGRALPHLTERQRGRPADQRQRRAGDRQRPARSISTVVFTL
jgi:hypothetical protein